MSYLPKRLFGHELTNVFSFPNFKPSIDLNLHPPFKKPALQHSIDNSHVLLTKDPIKPSLSPLLNDLESQQQTVPEYFSENIKHMLLVQKTQQMITDYFIDQEDLSKSMREMLLDWIVELHYKFKMFPNTLFLTVNIIDRYLQEVQIDRNVLQLVGTAALYIAAKYEETYEIPELVELVRLTACTFCEQEILVMEGDILKHLDFNILQQTSYRFFEPLALVVDLMDKKNFCLCRYVLELSLYDTIGWRYSPSLLACSTIYLINKIRKREFGWRQQLEELTGYKQSDLKAPAKELCFLLQNAKEFKNGHNIRKKFSRAQFHEVTRIRIQRRSR